MFAGQYEDTETGLVYNRYRYYNPHAGIYTTQDPLGVGPNPATAQGYVPNPLTWPDKLGLNACGNPPFDDLQTIIDRVGEKSISPKPNHNNVFEVASEDSVKSLWSELSEGHEVLDRGPSKMTEMKFFEASDGTMVQYRSGSKSGGATIDIQNKQKIPIRDFDTGIPEIFKLFKVHVVK